MNDEQNVKKIINFIKQYPHIGLNEFVKSTACRPCFLRQYLQLFSKFDIATRDLCAFLYSSNKCFSHFFKTKLIQQNLISSQVICSRDFQSSLHLYAQHSLTDPIEAILDDNLDFFIENINHSKKHYANYVIYITFENGLTPSNFDLDELSALFRATKIFRWFFANHKDTIMMHSSFPSYAFCGGSEEIIQLCIQNDIPLLEDGFAIFCALSARNDSIFQWALSQTDFELNNFINRFDEIGNGSIPSYFSLKVLYSIYQLVPSVNYSNLLASFAHDNKFDLVKLFIDKTFINARLFISIRDPEILDKIIDGKYAYYFEIAANMKSIFHIKYIITHPKCSLGELNLIKIDKNLINALGIRDIIRSQFSSGNDGRIYFQEYQLFRDFDNIHTFEALKFDLESNHNGFVDEILSNEEYRSALSKQEAHTLIDMITKSEENNEDENKEEKAVLPIKQAGKSIWKKGTTSSSNSLSSSKKLNAQYYLMLRILKSGCDQSDVSFILKTINRKHTTNEKN